MVLELLEKINGLLSDSIVKNIIKRCANDYGFEVIHRLYKIITNKHNENFQEPHRQVIARIFKTYPLLTDETIKRMFENLLDSSCDKNKQKYVHPKIPLILEEISHEQAKLILELNRHRIVIQNREFYLKLPQTRGVAHWKDSDIVKEYSIIMDIEFLHATGIIDYLNLNDGKNSVVVFLNKFGELLAKACDLDNIDNLKEINNNSHN